MKRRKRRSSWASSFAMGAGRRSLYPSVWRLRPSRQRDTLLSLLAEAEEPGRASRLATIVPDQAAENGRFRHPRRSHEIESTFGYAYQFDASLYARSSALFGGERSGQNRGQGRRTDLNSETGSSTPLRSIPARL